MSNVKVRYTMWLMAVLSQLGAFVIVLAYYGLGWAFAHLGLMILLLFVVGQIGTRRTHTRP